MSTRIPSKLRSRQTGLRGIGAGVPANQAAMGVEDPVAAAKAATMRPEEIRKAEEEYLSKLSQVSEAAEELLAGEKNGWIALVQADRVVVDKIVRNEAVTSQQQDRVMELRQELQKSIDSAEEEVFDSPELEDPFRIEADDPTYEPVRDRARRKEIESRLEEFDFEQMVLRGYIEQNIPVRENLTYKFRSLTTTQTLWLEELVSRQKETSPHHLRHWFSLAQVAVSLVSINGKEIPPRIWEIKDKEHFWKALEQRLETIGGYPSVLTDDMIVQFVWFMGRVRKTNNSGGLVKRLGNF